MASTKQHSRALAPTQVWDEKVRRTPIPHQRTVRTDDVTVVTSGFGGKFLPIKMIPLLREDGVQNSSITLNFQMAELSNMLLNPIRATAMAYFVPKLAFDRFADMGTIDRSYNGIAEVNGTVVPWFEKIAFDETNPFWKTLGVHAPNGQDVNTDYIEAYNTLWNYIATQRSPSLTLRDKLDTTLAPAFWESTQMRYVVPNFDDALMDGRVPLSFVGGSEILPVISTASGNPPNGNRSVAGQTNPIDRPDGTKDWTGQVWAEMQENTATFSIADIDLARETMAWARLRNQFQGLSEDWMINQLLAGMRIADAGLQDPVLLSHGSTAMGVNERYATDAANLDQSVVDGQGSITLNVRLPQVQCGGVIVIAAQILPEQIYERQRDYYLRAVDTNELPDRTADELDVQPVDLVVNGAVDEKHSMPSDLFGYEPLNARWQRNAPNVGGKYYQADPAAPWTEVRNRIWDANVVDPQLGTDFYLATNLKHDVFADSNTDPFEIWAAGSVRIDGLTYFAGPLLEGVDDYEKVLEQVPRDRLIGDGTDVPA